MKLKKPQRPLRAFLSDFRQSNPNLHHLYVRWAYENLSLARRAAEELEARSQWPPSLWANNLRDSMREQIESDAAYFEAAAMLFAGIEPPEETADAEEINSNS